MMTITPLGQYLLREQPSLKDRIQEALDLQSECPADGGRRALGEILLSRRSITDDLLQACLMKQRADCFGHLELFQGMPPEAVRSLAVQSSHRIYPAGQVIFREREQGDSYYVIIAGSVLVTRESEGGAPVRIAELGPGEGFGEIALLAGGARTATVAAAARTVLICLPKASFDFLLAAVPAVAQAFVRLLAARLSHGNDLLAEAAAERLAYRQFITDQAEKHEPRLAGSSALFRRLSAELEAAAAKRVPVLLQGEPGTELRDAAAIIHAKQSGTTDIFFLDARQGERADPESGSDPVVRELDQVSGLFGRTQEILPLAGGRRIGLLMLADRGTAVIEHAEALTGAVQEMLADFLTNGTYRVAGEQRERSSGARLVFTSSADIAELSRNGLFSPRLAAFMLGQVIELPPLRRRKSDLRELADHLIRINSRQLGRAVTAISDDAYKAIMAYGWPGNTDELNAVLRRAITLSSGESLTAEHIFISSPPVSGRLALDLFRFPTLKNLLLNKKFPVLLQYASAPSILLIILVGLLGSQDPQRNAVLVLTWGFWEPAVVLGSLFFSRLWCSTCPLGPSGYALGRAVGLKRKVPQFIRKYGIYLSAAGIASIFWAESVFDMPASPRATALLVLAVGLSALTMGFIFERRTWCRYLCPLGGMVGFISTCSAVELRSNYNICNTSCRKHDCHVGNEKGEGCPVFEGPFSLRTNQNCVLCGNCVKVCPNNSPVFNLRIPGRELWASLSVDRGAAVIGAAMVGSELFRGFEQLGLFHRLAEAPGWLLSAALLLVGLIGAVGVAAAVAGRRLFPGSEAPDRGAVHVIYCLIPFSAAFEMNYHLSRMLSMGGSLFQVLARQLGLGMELPAFSAAPSTIKFLQVLILAGGALLSLKTGRTYAAGLGGSRSAVQLFLLLFGLLYLVFFLAV